jgi:hypothetical protein
MVSHKRNKHINWGGGGGKREEEMEQERQGIDVFKNFQYDFSSWIEQVWKNVLQFLVHILIFFQRLLISLTVMFIYF